MSITRQVLLPATLEEVEEGTRLVVIETGPRHPVASIGVPGLRMHLRSLARC